MANRLKQAIYGTIAAGALTGLAMFGNKAYDDVSNTVLGNYAQGCYEVYDAHIDAVTEVSAQAVLQDIENSAEFAGYYIPKSKSFKTENE